VEGIYMAMSECAALHPDEEFMAEQEELYGDDQEFYANPSDAAELNEMQQAALAHLESVFEQPPTMNGHKEEFEDIEEDQ
jgi:nucleotide-sensitive chloride channel 1A